MNSNTSTDTIIFDYVLQDYFDSKGNCIDINYENFPCSKCKSPGKVQTHTYNYEVYKCTACHHIFHVS